MDGISLAPIDRGNNISSCVARPAGLKAHTSNISWANRTGVPIAGTSNKSCVNRTFGNGSPPLIGAFAFKADRTELEELERMYALKDPRPCLP